MTSMDKETARLTLLRSRMIDGILGNIKDCSLNGHPTSRLPNNVNVSIKYVEGESLLLACDMRGIACSTGPACSSSSLEPSHVLLAIGLPHETAHGSLRFTLGRYTSREDVEYVIEVLPEIVRKLRVMSPLYKNGIHGLV